MVPFFNLGSLNATIQSRIEEAMLRVARSGRYILGPEVEAFEAEWAAYCGTRFCVGTGNALDAMELILKAYGIGPGHEVIVASNTYIATWLAVSNVGAVPVPVEPDPETYNLDPSKVEAAITTRTSAILVVHLYGRCAEMDALQQIALQRGLLLLEDAAQAHGSSFRGRKAGNLSHAAAFSFYPSKNLGALGDAGAVTTNNQELAETVRRMRNYGGVGRLDHRIRGKNSRLDEMQAAILRAKLPHLDGWNALRRMRADFYHEYLEDSGLVLPPKDEEHRESNHHLFVVRADNRPRYLRALVDLGMDTHIHYPEPPHLEGAYADLGYGAGSFPIAEKLAASVFSLPIGYPDVNVLEVSKALSNA